MTADNTAKATEDLSKSSGQKARSSRSTKAASEVSKVVEEQTVKPDSANTNDGDSMSTDNVVQITTRPVQEGGSEQSSIALRQPVAMVGDRPVMPSEIEVAETISVAGVRPIAVSHLVLAGSYLNGRPIEASSLRVLDMLPGDRPIFDSGFRAVEGAMLPGHRPIMASPHELLEASMLPGNRPIAPNEDDPEPAVLMGYLD
ncbi:hypothetical protein [Leptodesmis sp.]|uniref:hypothetical protein n=1 Tax=Leptodesmis sp. TaxID=3100501 RepID=UPI0040535A62